MAKFQPTAPKDQYIEDLTRTFKKDKYECKYNAASCRYDVRVEGCLIFSSISFKICENWVDQKIQWKENVEFTPEHQDFLRKITLEDNGISVGGLANELGEKMCHFKETSPENGSGFIFRLKKKKYYGTVKDCKESPKRD